MPKQSQPNTLGNYAGLGFQLIAIAVVLVYGGKWADSYFHTGPILLVTGVFLAVFGVIYILMKSLK